MSNMNLSSQGLLDDVELNFQLEALKGRRSKATPSLNRSFDALSTATEVPNFIDIANKSRKKSKPLPYKHVKARVDCSTPMTSLMEPSLIKKARSAIELESRLGRNTSSSLSEVDQFLRKYSLNDDTSPQYLAEKREATATNLTHKHFHDTKLKRELTSLTMDVCVFHEAKRMHTQAHTLVEEANAFAKILNEPVRFELLAGDDEETALQTQQPTDPTATTTAAFWKQLRCELQQFNTSAAATSMRIQAQGPQSVPSTSRTTSSHQQPSNWEDSDNNDINNTAAASIDPLTRRIPTGTARQLRNMHVRIIQTPDVATTADQGARLIAPSSASVSASVTSFHQGGTHQLQAHTTIVSMSKFLKQHHAQLRLKVDKHTSLAPTTPKNYNLNHCYIHGHAGVRSDLEYDADPPNAMKQALAQYGTRAAAHQQTHPNTTEHAHVISESHAPHHQQQQQKAQSSQPPLPQTRDELIQRLTTLLQESVSSTKQLETQIEDIHRRGWNML